MLEFEGRVKESKIQTKDPDIEVSVFLDSAQVGTINVTLDQWDRLRLHRTLTSAAITAGVAIHVYAEGSEDRPVEAERKIL